MFPPRVGSSASAHLDALRALAAILVALQHARLVLVIYAADVPRLNWPMKFFYFVTNLGPTSVIVFFVLSGFLIGAPLIRDMRQNTWSWRKYAAARVSRIYVVLIPAILIGGAFDVLGVRCLGSSVVYATPHFGVMMPASVRANLSPLIGLGNLLCLQEVAVPTFGSNHALWSLANEWWYYWLFPLVVVVFVGRTRVALRILCIGLLGVILLLLTPSIRWAFGVWAMGAALAFVPRMRIRYWHTCVVIGLFLIWLVLQSLKVVSLNQYVIGGFTGTMVYCFNAQPEGCLPALYRSISSRLASLSYTLYACHSPFIVFLSAVILRNHVKFLPDREGIAITVAVLVVTVVYATCLWFLFERHTAVVRRWLSRTLGTPAQATLVIS